MPILLNTFIKNKKRKNLLNLYKREYSKTQKVKSQYPWPNGVNELNAYNNTVAEILYDEIQPLVNTVTIDMVKNVFMQDWRMEPLNRYLAVNKIVTIAEKQLLLNSIMGIKDKDDTASLCHYNKIYSALCSIYDHTPNDKSIDWNLIRTQEKK